MSTALDRIRIVLVRTSHPGNIGSVCRAMKTMGLSRLYLVNPETPVTEDSYALSAGAPELLDQAVICTSLGEALQGAEIVIGASARKRTIERPLLSPRSMAHFAVSSAVQNVEVALVFGCERTGLTNEELEICGYHVTIDANPQYSSLNLAMAVQVLAYEVRTAFLEREEKGASADLTPSEPREILADGCEVEGFYQQLEKVLFKSGFLRVNGETPVLRKIKRIFTRPYLTRDDVHILRGILSTVDKAMKQKSDVNE